VLQFELILALLFLGVILAGVARRLNTPYPVLLALLGAGLAFAPNLPELNLGPDLILALFVAPILLDAAYDASLRDLKDNWRPVAGLALVAVTLTVVSVAFVVRWLVPDMPWSAAIALGAIVAPPDASAATAVLQHLRPPHRVLVILEGESLFNDASALLILRLAVGFTGTAALLHAIPLLALGTIASAFFGLFLGKLYVRFASRISDTATAILIQFLGVFLVWIAAERLHLSGIITVVCFSITVARISPIIIPARMRIPSYAVWEVVVFTLNILVFILVGIQLKLFLHRLTAQEWSTYLKVGLAVCATAILVRIVWVMSYNSVVRWKNRRYGVALPRPMMRPTVQGGVIISWCGMRGIVTLAAALSLPQASGETPGFPYRDLILFSAFCVVFGTLTIQGLTLRPLMLALAFKDDGAVESEVRHANRATSEAALRILANLPPSKEVAVVRREYERRAGGDRNSEAKSLKSGLTRIQHLAISAERDALLQLRKNGEIGDAAFHLIEERLDWAEVHVAR